MMLKAFAPVFFPHAGKCHSAGRLASAAATYLPYAAGRSFASSAMATQQQQTAAAGVASPSSSSSPDAAKSKLSTLRKKTGYSFMHCKKALEQFNGSVPEAERWLHQQAQQEGWSKATKLEGRKTAEGLIGFKRTSNAVALVEVNCETDFVARNSKFHELVARIADSCVSSVSKGKSHATDAGVTTGNGQNEFFRKTWLPGDHIGRLTVLPTKQQESSEQTSVKDLVALFIGQLGENIQVRRGAVYSTAPNNKKQPNAACLSGYIHAANTSVHTSVDGVVFGRFGSVLAWKSTASDNNPDGNAGEEKKQQEHIGRLVCQHIVGMRPTSIGRTDDEDVGAADEETRLLHQEFLAEPESTVGEVLEENSMQVLDFIRFACGEDDQQAQQTEQEANSNADSKNREAEMHREVNA